MAWKAFYCPQQPIPETWNKAKGKFDEKTYLHLSTYFPLQLTFEIRHQKEECRTSFLFHYNAKKLKGIALTPGRIFLSHVQKVMSSFSAKKVKGIKIKAT